MIVSINAGGKNDNIPHPFMSKALSKVGIERNFCNLIKGIDNKFKATFVTVSEVLRTFSLKSAIRQGCLLLPVLVSIVPGVLDSKV